MKSISLMRSGELINLFEYMEDFYLIANEANNALKQLRIGLPTWVSKEQYSEMNISLWVYYDDIHPNAFCYYVDGNNYIALSSRLLVELWNAAEDFTNKEKLSLVFKLSEDNKHSYAEALYFYMLNFIIAHEFGHIAHGHLKDNNCKTGIDEMLMTINETSDKYRQTNNWLTQLKEYDADSFAVAINSILFLQQWSDDFKANLSNFDKLFVSNYLCFQVFAEKTGRNFDMYFSKNVAEYDHPYPGIRMYYTFIWYSYWIGRVRGFGEDTMKILYSGCHAILAYEKSILENEEIKECYFSVALTEKGVQHIMNLHNGWKEIINQLNQFAYCPIEEVDAIDSIPFSLDENGCFINK